MISDLFMISSSRLQHYGLCPTTALLFFFAIFTGKVGWFMNCVTTAEMIRNVSQCVDYLVNWNLVSKWLMEEMSSGKVIFVNLKLFQAFEATASGCGNV